MTDARSRVPGRVGSSWVIVVAILTVSVAACSSSDPGGTTGGAPSTAPRGSLPVTHIHGVGVDPGNGTIFLATHDGLFRVAEDGGSTRVGPVMDLMGFAVAGPGHFLASGHPGPDGDLPQPVGLIESTDGGRTWQPVSRQGVSDFHALTVSDGGVLGYDGSLWRSPDGGEWERVVIPAPPATLAASPDGSSTLATTREGLLGSADGGRSWSGIEGAPLLQVVDWAGDGRTLVGVDPSGRVWTSSDSAATWQEGPQLGSPPLAVEVASSDDGTRAVVVTTEALLESQDGGATFAVLLEH